MLCAVLVAAFVSCCMSVPALATSSVSNEFATLGKKTASPTVIPGQYEITVGVPGAIASEKYSEIIVMVDASSSQGANLDKLKTMLVHLGEEVLHDDGSVRLTLMGFGMGPTYVGSFYNADSLEAYLKDVTQDDLRQGVSATNCEAALDFVLDYIESSENLRETCVFFTSDAMTNMDETRFALSTWDEHPEWWANGVTAEIIAQVTASAQTQHLLNGGEIVSATARLYPAESLAVEVAASAYGVDSAEHKAAVDALYNAITATQQSGIAYVDAVYADVLANSGMTYADDHAGYSTSELEKAFLDYRGGVFTNPYLYTIHGMMKAGFYPDWYNLSTWGARAADAADRLAAHEKVVELHMIDFKGKAGNWMDPASATGNQVTSGKINYVHSSNFSAALDDIEDIAGSVFTTVYKDVKVTDPMSKWVDLDPSSIRIYKDKTLIYRYGEGWLYDNKKPSANPITLTQDSTGKYTITWNIKDGYLLYTDRYSLRYRVNVDETVEGFQHDTPYPANDTTYATWTDVNGELRISDIPVPDVELPEPPKDFEPEEKGLKIFKSDLETGAPIPNIKFSVYSVVPPEGTAISPKPTDAEIAYFATTANLVATVTTDAAGYAAINLTDLGYGDGTYLVIEEKSEKVVAPAAPFYVNVPLWDKATETNLDLVVIYPKNELVPEKPPVPPIFPPDDNPEKGKILLYKHAKGDTSKVLAGAEFQVYRLAETEAEMKDSAAIPYVYGEQTLYLIPFMQDGSPVVMTTDDDGYAASAEMPFGLYFVVETVAPFGYGLLEEPVPVYVTVTSDQVAYATNIANTPVFDLPSTGGEGTVLLTAAGVLLCCVAGVLLVVRKRGSRSGDKS